MYYGGISVVLWLYHCCFSVVLRLYNGCIAVVFRLYLGCTTAVHRLYNGCIAVVWNTETKEKHRTDGSVTSTAIAAHSARTDNTNTIGIAMCITVSGFYCFPSVSKPLLFRWKF